MKANPLGDIRAEADRLMLHHAFVETPDYKALAATTERPIVVGRRGAGKSALLLGLERYWRRTSRTRVVVLAPEEHEMIGLRPLIAHFGDSPLLLRAVCRIAWRYALMMELTCAASQTYKFPDTPAACLLRDHAGRWRKWTGVSGRLLHTLRPQLSSSTTPEEQIADLPGALELKRIQDALVEILPGLKTKFVLLLDRLDEGFEADRVGTALVNGLVLAAIEVNDRMPTCHTKLFVRDNIARAIAEADPDYSRDIEGQIMRLHWDERFLMEFACNRLRRAFGIDIESNVRTWNQCAGSNLHGMSGFRKALRLTLYRPRDILALLNQAIYRASSRERERIVLDDLEASAQEISTTRLGDLHKEYKAILPGIRVLTQAFQGLDPEVSGAAAADVVRSVTEGTAADRAAQQHFEIVDDPYELLKSLYSVGFLGVRETTSGAFAFCHDGSPPTRAIGPDESILVHPCYWIALGLRRRLLADAEVEEIQDEYEIYINSETGEIRRAALSRYIAELDGVPTGEEGAAAFEEWCLKTARILFAGQLANIELHPNKQATQRRDIVGTVVAEQGVWKRILDDYKTRQVVFEVKNRTGLDAGDYRQVLSYLTDEYGNCGFIVNRDVDVELTKGSTEMQSAKEMYDKQNKLVVKLTGKFLSRLLSKTRNPQKHDEANKRLGKLLDDYVRRYMAGIGAGVGARKAKRRRRRAGRGG